MTEVASILPYDFHVHSSLSHDGNGTIIEYCEKALTMGVKAIGFCEHLDLDPRDAVSGMHDYKLYRSLIEEAREAHGDRLIICMGAEVGYVPRMGGEISDYLAGHAYDFVVGSIHTIFDGESGISDEYDALETFARCELWAAYENYFETVNDMVKTGLFDVVGHLDLINRFGVNHMEGELEWGRFYGVLRRILEGAIKRQMPVEINTSGLRQAPRLTYPGREVLKLYKELGGEQVLVGSDAHDPADLGGGIPAAIKLTREFKLDPDIYFKDRIPLRIKGRS